MQHGSDSLQPTAKLNCHEAGEAPGVEQCVVQETDERPFSELPCWQCIHDDVKKLYLLGVNLASRCQWQQQCRVLRAMLPLLVTSLSTTEASQWVPDFAMRGVRAHGRLLPNGVKRTGFRDVLL